MTDSLYQRTSQLLKECSVTLPEISARSGIPFAWLKKFKSGSIKDPSVNRIQRLYEYLSGSNLKV